MKNTIATIIREGEVTLQELQLLQELYIIFGYNVKDITIGTAMVLREHIKMEIAVKMKELNLTVNK